MPKTLLLLASCLALLFCQTSVVEEPNSMLKDTGVLLIDVQKAFIPGEESYFPKYTPPEDVAPTLGRLKGLIELADQMDLPIFLTYELSDEGDSAMPDQVSSGLPTNRQKSFIKSFFNATAHPEFTRMVRASGVKRLVVGGAETDVCVLQTVLGLLEMGIEVYLLRDAVFTNEFNYEPALQRMEQAGAMLILFDEFRQSVLEDRAIGANPSCTARLAGTPRPIAIKPNRIALVVMGPPARDTHSYKKAVLERIQQTLFAAYIFDVPLMLMNAQSPGESLPDGIALIESKVRSFNRTTMSESNTSELVEVLRAKEIDQVAVLGVSQNGSLFVVAQDLAGAGFQVFLMEDAIAARGELLQLEDSLQAAYQSGSIPLTYKSFYYGMTKAADKSDWLSPKWQERLDELDEKDVGRVKPYDLLPMD